MSYLTKIPPMPLTSVSPFNHRDGTTYLQILRDLRESVVRLAQAQVDLDGKMDARLIQLNDLIDLVEAEIESALVAIRVEGDKYLPEMVATYNRLKDLADTIEPLLETSRRLDEEIANRSEADTLLQNTLTTAVSDLTGDMQQADTALSARLTVFESRTPEHYGAVGNGDVDDTAAVREWVDKVGGTLPPRAYRITGGLTVTRDGYTLNGGGSTLLVDGDDTVASRVLSITGDRAHVHGLNIQGVAGSKVRGGVYVYGSHATINDNTITGLRSDNESRGIHVEGAGGNLISGNRIHDFFATGDTVGGNGTGMTRGIVVYTQEDAVFPTHVSGNHITDILGEEGDGITVLASAGDGSTWKRAYATIDGNVVDNCSRRAIKVQGMRVDVTGNSLWDTKRQVFGNEASLINVYQSGLVSIKDNTLHFSDIGSSINVQGDRVGTKQQYLTVSGNTIYAEPGTEGNGIFVDYTDRVNVNSNTIYGGFRGVVLGNVTSGAVTGNVIGQLTQRTNAAAVSVSASCDRVTVTGNTDTSVNINNTFRNDGSNGVLENNHQVIS